MKVLFTRFSATGDIVLTTGPIDYFHRKFPEAQIDILTSPGGEELLSSLPYINKFHTVPKGSSLLKIISIYLKIPSYDYIFDFQGSLKSQLVSLFTKAKYLKIEKHSRERRAYVKSRKFKSLLTDHVVQKYAKVYLDEFNLNIPELEKLRPRFPNFKPQNDIELPKKYIVLHPYASQKNKEWPYFFELSNLLISNNINVVVVGNGESHFPKEVINISNQTSLRQLFSVIQNASAVVTTDSGPLHISVAFQIPTLSVFGPTTKELGFYPNFKKTLVLEDNDLQCRPCHVHGGNTCPLQHFQCMYNLSAQQAYNELHGLLLKYKN